MRIGIIALSLNKSAVPGYYNSQELGMGKAFASKGHTTTVYKLFDRAKLSAPQTDQPTEHLRYVKLPARSLGINGFFDLSLLDPELDILICFCDTQLYTRKVAKWCRRHKITFYPYVGVITSSSTNAIKKRLMDLTTKRLIRFYRTLPEIWGKTPSICQYLKTLGIYKTKLVPIGLDEELLYTNYADTDKRSLKPACGFAENDKILLFIGRLVPEKEPLEMIRLFEAIHRKDTDTKLCMIGKGPLESEISAMIQTLKLTGSVTLLSSVPNRDMWKFYRISSCYVNLNHHEIYGMSILEAMYYECPVIAYHAPGPDYILDGGRCGSLCDSQEELLTALQTLPDRMKAARERVVTNYLWKNCIPEVTK